MQAVEALTRLIAHADKELLERHSNHLLGYSGESEEAMPDEDGLGAATAICQAMLNTAIPVARFRCHVSVEKIGSGSNLGLGDFTVSATSIGAIKNGLAGLARESVVIHATLWEQRATGADMLSGYQGQSKTLGYRNWLKQIDQYQTEPTFQ